MSAMAIDQPADAAADASSAVGGPGGVGQVAGTGGTGIGGGTGGTGGGTGGGATGATGGPDPDPEGKMPWWIYAVEVAWLVVLIALFFVWIETPSLRHDLPHFYGQNPGIPVEVPWFGAIGGCLASLGGIFFYNRKWKASYNLWHPVKPLVGAVTGGISCMLLVVTLRAATSNTKIKTDPITFDTAAFLFGYAESAFRQLVKNVTDILIKPGPTTPPPAGPSDAGASGATGGASGDATGVPQAPFAPARSGPTGPPAS